MTSMKPTAAILAAALLLTLTGCGSTAPAPAKPTAASSVPSAPTDGVVYAVTGTGSVTDLLLGFTDDAGWTVPGTSVLVTRAALPYRRGFAIPDGATRFQMHATGDTTTTALACSITVRGVLVNHRTGTGSVWCDSAP